MFGLSFAFGAFVAGIVLSESDYGHQALSDIIPCVMFWIAILCFCWHVARPTFVIENWQMVLLVVLLVGVGKAVIFGTE